MFPASPLIPQHPPFVLVDAVLEINGDRILSAFTIPEEHVLVNDGQLTAGGLIENMAQTMAAAAGYIAKQNGTQPENGFIAAIKQLTINKLPASNTTITTEVVTGSPVMNIRTAAARVYLNGALIASCALTVVVSE
jgi:predicted hotdog family 3-hydroxylacyl-ACP dehydratase